MQILSFDTSAYDVQIALMQNGSLVFEELSPPAQKNRQESASVLLPAIDAALRKLSWQKSDLDLIVVGIGPGSFTGVRVSVITARSIGQALGIGVVPINRLEVLALRCQHPGAVVLNAGSGKLFIAAFDKDLKSDQDENQSNASQQPACSGNSAYSACKELTKPKSDQDRAAERAREHQHLTGFAGQEPDQVMNQAIVEPWSHAATCLAGFEPGCRPLVEPFCGSPQDLQTVLANLDYLVLEPGLDEAVLAKDKILLPYPADCNLASDAAILAYTRLSSAGGNTKRQSLAQVYPWDNVLPLYLRSPSVTLKAENGSSNKTAISG